MKIKTIVLLFFLTMPFTHADLINMTADFMRYEAAEGREYTLLSGNAYVKTGNKEILLDC